MAPFVVSARHPPAGEIGAFPGLPVSIRRIRVAVISALCSVVLIVFMAGAAIMCADNACRGLPDPRAVLEVENGHSDPAVPSGPPTGVVGH